MITQEISIIGELLKEKDLSVLKVLEIIKKEKNSSWHIIVIFYIYQIRYLVKNDSSYLLENNIVNEYG